MFGKFNEPNVYSYVPGPDAARESKADRQYNDSEELDSFAGALDDLAALAGDEEEAIEGYWDFLEKHMAAFGDKADTVRQIIVGIIQDEKAHALVLHAVAQYLDKAAPSFRPELLRLCREGLGVCPEMASCFNGQMEGYEPPEPPEGEPGNDGEEPMPVPDKPMETTTDVTVTADGPGGYASVHCDPNDLEKIEGTLTQLKELMKQAKPRRGVR